jgi:hypothetical protein
MNRFAFYLALSSFVFGAGFGQQSFLLIPDWTNDRVCALSPVDGSVINANFIPTNNQLFDSPKHALPTPRGTILVADQVRDAVHEFDGFGNYIRTIANLQNNQIDNIRGIAIREGKLYVTVASGTLQNTIQRFNLDGTGQETFINANLSSPFAIFFRENDMLITNSSSHLIQRFDLNGAFQNTWVGTTIRFPQQITRRRSNGNLLVAGFSSPAGIYEYNDAGVQVAYYNVSTGPRGAYELENGRILFTDGAGVKTFDPNAPNPANTVQTVLTGGNYQYIELYEILPSDVNRDRCVDDADLLEALFQFGGSGRADLNGDTIVDDADLLVVLFNFGAGCE